MAGEVPTQKLKYTPSVFINVILFDSLTVQLVNDRGIPLGGGWVEEREGGWEISPTHTHTHETLLPQVFPTIPDQYNYYICTGRSNVIITSFRRQPRFCFCMIR